MTVAATTGDRPGTALEVLLAFTKLGVSSFGGPIAHIGYFRQEFVMLDERAYADIVALCQSETCRESGHSGSAAHGRPVAHTD